MIASGPGSYGQPDPQVAGARLSEFGAGGVKVGAVIGRLPEGLSGLIDGFNAGSHGASYTNTSGIKPTGLNA